MTDRTPTLAVLRAQAGVADAPDLVEAIGAFSLGQVDRLAEGSPVGTADTFG